MNHKHTLVVADTPRNRTLWNEHPTAPIAPCHIWLAPEESHRFGGAQWVWVVFASKAERGMTGVALNG